MNARKSQDSFRLEGQLEVELWTGVVKATVADCINAKKRPSPVYCAHLAAEIADAAVIEYRRRVK